MIVMTRPSAAPIISAAGYDPVWFGIFLVLVVEMSQIMPPVGFNLFVIQSLTGEGPGSIALMTLPCLLISGLVRGCPGDLSRHGTVVTGGLSQ